MNETIKRLEAALHLIGNLPMEFNSRARAIAQNSVTPPEGGWRDTFTPEQIGKLLRWDGRELQRAKEKAMDNEKHALNDQPETETPYLPPTIEMIPVESSNLKGFGHDGNKTLRVWFLNGTSYDYPGIEEADFFELVNAPSPGKAYNALTRGKGIKGIKL